MYYLDPKVERLYRIFIFIKPKTDAQTIVDRMKAEKMILIKTYPNVG